MNPLGVVIIAEWVVTIVGAVVFAAVLRPWQAMDRQVGWHLFWGAVAAALQPAGLLLAGVSLWFPLLSEGLAMAIVWWRLWLLIQTRRRRG